MKYLQPLLISLAAVFAPIKSVLLVTEFLILADLISGVLAAKKRGEKITSAGYQRSVVKFLVYNLATITAFLIETYLVENVFPITKIVSSIIGVTEGLSIFENLNSINGTDIFKQVLSILGSKNAEVKTEIAEVIPEVKGSSEEPPKV